MTRILLARHGETAHNDDGRLQGRTDVALNATGRDQAEALAERLEPLDIDAAYASSLSRARETAEIVAGPHPVEVEQLDALREMDLGALEGEDTDRFWEAVQREGNMLRHWNPPEGETMHEVEHRALATLEEVTDAHPDGTALVVAHGVVNRSVLMGILDIPPGNYPRLRQDNTALNELYHGDRGWLVRTVNDTSHLR